MVDKASHKQQPLNSIPGDVLFVRAQRILCACRIVCMLYVCLFVLKPATAAKQQYLLVSSRLVSSLYLARINDDFLKLLGSAV